MPLAPGSRIGPYEIATQIGEGGMGVVYRAVDTNLKRAVAIKVLPAAVSTDADRIARFQREAETLASLNHPNIASVYGLERYDAIDGKSPTLALVMELVEGPTLAERIAQGPLAIDELVPVARQVAEALEAAHEHGVVHRDLKPANVKVRPDGTVKVLDFGLAKALEPASAVNVSQLPTVTTPAMTQMGMILGTAAYMSPEQAAGRPVDRRTDIWSFGALLWEMLTGRRLFQGESVAHTMADVLRADVPFDALPPATPPALTALLRRCLDRDAKTRLRDIGEARVVLQSALALSDRAEPAPTVDIAALTAQARLAKGYRNRLRWLSAAAVLLVAALPVVWSLRPPRPVMELMRADVALPEGVTIPPPGVQRLAVSADGSRLAFAGVDANGQSRLWVRNLRSGDTVEIPESDGAEMPSWSPDGRWLGFAAGGRVMRVEAAGGTPSPIAEGSGVRWNAAGEMVVGGVPNFSSQLRRVPAGGGQSQTIFALDASVGETRQLIEGFLPGGQRFLYQSQRPNVQGGFVQMLGSLDGTIRKELSGAANSPSPVEFVGRTPTSDDGWLLYVRQRQLYARPFDSGAGAFTGEERLLVNDVPNGPIWAVSDGGVLAYLRGEAAQTTIAWYDRTGAQRGIVASGSQLGAPRLSPDGRTIAFSREQRAQLYELDRGMTTNLVTDRGGRPVWNADGKTLFLDTVRDGKRMTLLRAADGSGDQQVRFEWPSPEPAGVMSVSRTGDWLLLLEKGGMTFVSREGRRIPFYDGRSLAAYVSPDGRWVVTALVVGGRQEIMVLPAPPEAGGIPGAARVRISLAGGGQPAWAPSGKEIYYVAPDLKMMAVPVEMTANSIRPGAPVALFETRLTGTGDRQFDVAADGRFLINQVLPGGARVQVSVIVNWTRLLD